MEVRWSIARNADKKINSVKECIADLIEYCAHSGINFAEQLSQGATLWQKRQDTLNKHAPAVKKD